MLVFFVVLGLLIAVAAATFTAVVIVEDWGGSTYAVHGFGHVLGHLTLADVFVAGLAIGMVFCLALAVAMASGVSYRRVVGRRRVEERALRERYESAIAERDRLARERGDEHHDGAGSVAHSPYPTADPQTQEFGRHRV